MKNRTHFLYSYIYIKNPNTESFLTQGMRRWKKKKGWQYVEWKMRCVWGVFIIQGVSKRLGQTSGLSVPHRNKTDSSYQYGKAATCFRGIAQQYADKVLWGTLKNSSVLRSNWKWRHNSPKHFLCLSIRDCSGTYAVCDSPWPDVLMRAGGRHFELLLWIVTW